MRSECSQPHGLRRHRRLARGVFWLLQALFVVVLSTSLVVFFDSSGRAALLLGVPPPTVRHECAMSFTHPIYTPLPLDAGGGANPLPVSNDPDASSGPLSGDTPRAPTTTDGFGLFVFEEGQFDRGRRVADGEASAAGLASAPHADIPLLFVPGNAGSYLDSRGAAHAVAVANVRRSVHTAERLLHAAAHMQPATATASFAEALRNPPRPGELSFARPPTGALGVRPFALSLQELALVHSGRTLLLAAEAVAASALRLRGAFLKHHRHHNHQQQAAAVIAKLTADVCLFGGEAAVSELLAPRPDRCEAVRALVAGPHGPPLRRDVAEAVRGEVAAFRRRGLWLVGHSIGGTAARLGAILALARRPGSIAGVVTIAAPNRYPPVFGDAATVALYRHMHAYYAGAVLGGGGGGPSLSRCEAEEDRPAKHEKESGAGRGVGWTTEQLFPLDADFGGPAATQDAARAEGPALSSVACEISRLPVVAITVGAFDKQVHAPSTALEGPPARRRVSVSTEQLLQGGFTTTHHGANYCRQLLNAFGYGYVALATSGLTSTLPAGPSPDHVRAAFKTFLSLPSPAPPKDGSEVKDDARPVPSTASSICRLPMPEDDSDIVAATSAAHPDRSTAASVARVGYAIVALNRAVLHADDVTVATLAADTTTNADGANSVWPQVVAAWAVPFRDRASAHREGFNGPLPASDGTTAAAFPRRTIRSALLIRVERPQAPSHAARSTSTMLSIAVPVGGGDRRRLRCSAQWLVPPQSTSRAEPNPLPPDALWRVSDGVTLRRLEPAAAPTHVAGGPQADGAVAMVLPLAALLASPPPTAPSASRDPSRAAALVALDSAQFLFGDLAVGPPTGGESPQRAAVGGGCPLVGPLGSQEDHPTDVAVIALGPLTADADDAARPSSPSADVLLRLAAVATFDSGHRVTLTSASGGRINAVAFTHWEAVMNAVLVRAAVAVQRAQAVPAVAAGPVAVLVMLSAHSLLAALGSMRRGWSFSSSPLLVSPVSPRALLGATHLLLALAAAAVGLTRLEENTWLLRTQHGSPVAPPHPSHAGVVPALIMACFGAVLAVAVFVAVRALLLVLLPSTAAIVSRCVRRRSKVATTLTTATAASTAPPHLSSRAATRRRRAVTAITIIAVGGLYGCLPSCVDGLLLVAVVGLVAAVGAATVAAIHEASATCMSVGYASAEGLLVHGLTCVVLWVLDMGFFHLRNRLVAPPAVAAMLPPGDCGPEQRWPAHMALLSLLLLLYACLNAPRRRGHLPVPVGGTISHDRSSSERQCAGGGGVKNRSVARPLLRRCTIQTVAVIGVSLGGSAVVMAIMAVLAEPLEVAVRSQGLLAAMLLVQVLAVYAARRMET